jgi:hypothetical protein
MIEGPQVAIRFRNEDRLYLVFMGVWNEDRLYLIFMGVWNEDGLYLVLISVQRWRFHDGVQFLPDGFNRNVRLVDNPLRFELLLGIDRLLELGFLWSE